MSDSGSPEASRLDALVSSALNIEAMNCVLDSALPGFVVQNASLIRLKPARRAVVQYEFVNPQGIHERCIAKIRAKGLDRRSFETVSWLYQHGFDAQASDGVSVPMALAAIEPLNMVISRMVSGVGVMGDLSSAPRVARALAKLNGTAMLTTREHTIAEEIETLRKGYQSLEEAKPDLASRLQCVLQKLVERLKRFPSPSVLLHRDFYHDQVLCEPDRIWILDLDLAARGPAALDVGNFVGHLIELSIRQQDRATELLDAASKFEHAYRSVRADVSAESIQSFAAATLARHVYLCQRFEDRRAFLPAILERTESML